MYLRTHFVVFLLCLLSIKVGVEDTYQLKLNTGREVLNVSSQTISKRIVSVLLIVSFGMVISVPDFVMVGWLVRVMTLQLLCIITR